MGEVDFFGKTILADKLKEDRVRKVVIASVSGDAPFTAIGTIASGPIPLKHYGRWLVSSVEDLLVHWHALQLDKMVDSSPLDLTTVHAASG